MGVLLGGGAKDGLAVSVAEAQAAHAASARLADGSIAPLQLPLLPVAESQDDETAAEIQLPAPRGPGRPPGARNRSTEEWRNTFLGKYRSPLMVLGEIYSRPVKQLAEELCCTTLEAFDVQRRAAEAALPYIHQKQATAIDLGGAKVVNLFIDPGQAAAPSQPRQAGDDAVVISGETVPFDSEENQGLSASAASDLDSSDLDSSSQAADPVEQSPDRAPDQTSASEGDE